MKDILIHLYEGESKAVAVYAWVAGRINQFDVE
jgi:hypothetical protein